MNVVVCVKQIPDPAVPGALDADHTLNREGKLILDESDSYGVEMALQLVDKAGGGEVTLVSMAPNNEVSGLRTALAMGAAKAILVSDDRARRLRRARRPPRCSPSASSAPATSTSCSPRPSRPTATPARSPAQVAELLGWPSLTFAKHVEIGDGKVDDPAPDRGRLRHRRGVAARGRERDGRCRRAALPVVQGDHGGEEQAGRPGDGADLGLDADQVGWSGARQEITNVEQAPAREAGEKFEDDGDGAEKVVGVPRAAEGGLSRWLSARSGCTRRPTATSRRPRTLELLTKAREIGDTVEAIYAGAERRRARRRARRVRRDEGVRRRPRRRCCPASGRRGGASRRSSRRTQPDLILFAQSYDGRDALARLSVKLDRPVLTNGTDLKVDGDT